MTAIENTRMKGRGVVIATMFMLFSMILLFAYLLVYAVVLSRPKVRQMEGT